MPLAWLHWLTNLAMSTAKGGLWCHQWHCKSDDREPQLVPVGPRSAAMGLKTVGFCGLNLARGAYTATGPFGSVA